MWLEFSEHTLRGPIQCTIFTAQKLLDSQRAFKDVALGMEHYKAQTCGMRHPSKMHPGFNQTQIPWNLEPIW